MLITSLRPPPSFHSKLLKETLKISMDDEKKNYSTPPYQLISYKGTSYKEPANAYIRQSSGLSHVT